MRLWPFVAIHCVRVSIFIYNILRISRIWAVTAVDPQTSQRNNIANAEMTQKNCLLGFFVNCVLSLSNNNNNSSIEKTQQRRALLCTRECVCVWERKTSMHMMRAVLVGHSLWGHSINHFSFISFIFTVHFCCGPVFHLLRGSLPDLSSLVAVCSTYLAFDVCVCMCGWARCCCFTMLIYFLFSILLFVCCWFFGNDKQQ